MQAQATQNLSRLMDALVDYHKVRAKLTWQEVLEKKGRDLSIQLYDATKGRQWGGRGKNPGIAEAEMRLRAQQRRGTILRKSLRDEYDSRLAKVARLSAAATRGVRVTGISKQERAQIAKVRRDQRSGRGALWRSMVGREVGLRQQGIGVLAVGWLWYRQRSTRKGVVFVKNQTGRKLGWVSISDNSLQVTNVQRGIGILVDRYRIVQRAESAALSDIAIYMGKKQGRAMGLAFLEHGLPTRL